MDRSLMKCWHSFGNCKNLTKSKASSIFNRLSFSGTLKIGAQFTLQLDLNSRIYLVEVNHLIKVAHFAHQIEEYYDIAQFIC